VGIRDSHAREEERDYGRILITPPFSNLTEISLNGFSRFWSGADSTRIHAGQRCAAAALIHCTIATIHC
jgi:hypothetical protein